MTDAPPPLTPAQLQEAFLQFTQASAQLTSQFESLQQQVQHLTQELATSNARLQAELMDKAALARRVSVLLAALPAGVLEVDASGVITAANSVAEQQFGADLPGRSWLDLALRHLRQTVTPHEWDWLDDQGRVRGRLAIGESLLSDGGRILLVSDVTDAHQMQHALEQHKKLAAMGEMAAGLAHQLRTPLATALLYTSHLTKPALPDAQRLRFAEKAQERLRHLEGLVGDMLLFVRGDTAERERIPLVALIEDALASVQAHAEQRAVILHAPADVEGWVQGSRPALIGALSNLLDNAVGFTPQEGVVELLVSQADGQVALSVVDQGPGIPPELRERVFEPFFTLRTEGTGLGLAIVQSVARVHGGSVELESVAGQGSCFTLRLPLV